MAIAENYQSFSFLANVDLSNYTAYPVRLSGSSTVDLANDVHMANGVLVTPAVAGQPCQVALAGIVPCIYGATVLAGRQLQVNSAHKAIHSTSSYGCFAQALEGGAVNEIHSVLLMPFSVSGSINS